MILLTVLVTVVMDLKAEMKIIQANEVGKLPLRILKALINECRYGNLFFILLGICVQKDELKQSLIFN